MKFIQIFLHIFLFVSLIHSSGSDKFGYSLKNDIDNLSPGETVSVWVFFTDKGENLAEKFEATERSLLSKTRKRRLRHFGTASPQIDFYDLPLCQEYVVQVNEYSQKMRQKSRWLNAVSIDVTKENLEKISDFRFVHRLDLVFKKDKPISVFETAAKIPFAKPTNAEYLNYGESFEQNQQINVVPLHEMGYDGSGVLVAMLDAGFNNLEHQALKHLNILATKDFVNQDSIVWDEPDQMGSGNHGTWTLSALAGFKEGFLMGPAYGADFLLAKTENTDWERHIEEDAWIAGAEWADSMGADIITSSLGYLNGFTDGEFNYTWQDMDGNTTIVTKGAELAASRGILVVNSAGNEGSPIPPIGNTLIGPSDGNSVLAVGSVGSDGIRSSFSSMGPTVDGRIKPDVMARGSRTFCASVLDTTSYTRVSGTSLSCPLVAGAAALILQAIPNITNIEIIEALRHTASQKNNPDNAYGWGIIDAFQAANYIKSSDNEEENVIGTLKLYENYPNPFNSTTTITFYISKADELNLSVYDILGKPVVELVVGWVESGMHTVTWNASQLGSGMYFIALENAGNRLVRKALLVK